MPRNELRSLQLPIAEELGRRAGIRPRVRPDECAAYAVAGRVPKLVFSPRTAAEASKTIDTLASEGAGIIIRGNGTKQHFPPAPIDVDAVLDTTRCSGVVDHEPSDLTITVAGGTPFREMQEALRVHHQFFPCDPPFGSDATVGGVLSARSAGALRQLYGSPRDNVLGMRICLSDGSVAFTGSRVVKSVAGYDIAKLFVGARGSLGFIAEATLKVAPLPAEQRGVAAWFRTVDDACGAAGSIASSDLFPMATTLHDPAASRHIRALADARLQGAWLLVARFGGGRTALAASIDRASQMCRSGRAIAVESLDVDRVAFAWADISELAGGAMYPSDDYIACKISSLPTAAPEVCCCVAKIFDEQESSAHPASGLVFPHVRAADGVTSGLRELQRRCDVNGWRLDYLASPVALAQTLRQPAPADLPLLLMRRVKAALDPSGTFDAGRFLAGI